MSLHLLSTKGGKLELVQKDGCFSGRKLAHKNNSLRTHAEHDNEPLYIFLNQLAFYNDSTLYMHFISHCEPRCAGIKSRLITRSDHNRSLGTLSLITRSTINIGILGYLRAFLLTKLIIIFYNIFLCCFLENNRSVFLYFNIINHIENQS